MKIIIDARMISNEIHGISRFLLQLLKIWKNKKINHKITLLTNNNIVLKKYQLLDFYECSQITSHPFSLKEFYEIPFIINKLKGDLYYSPSISVPFLKVIPTVITIHDLIPLYFGNLFHKIYCKTYLKNAAKYCDAITVVSNYTKIDVMKSFNIPSKKITVTHLGASPIKKSLPWIDIKNKFNINKPFIFCLGNPKPHKNIIGIIKIFNIIKQNYNGRLQLVIGSKNSKEIKKTINISPYKNDIIRVNYFNDNELETLFSNAKIFAYPSYFEGFGLPPIEAMKRGCPVVSSNRTSLKEVVGEGGILVDPDNTKKFAKEILEILKNNKKREIWSQKAMKWGKNFSWQNCAKKTIEIFENSIYSI